MQHWLPWLNIPSQTACACKQNFKRMNFYTPRQQNFKRMNFYTPRQWNTKTQSFQKLKKVANHLRVDNNKTKLITILICNIAQDTNWTKKKEIFTRSGAGAGAIGPGAAATHMTRSTTANRHMSVWRLPRSAIDLQRTNPNNITSCILYSFKWDIAT